MSHRAGQYRPWFFDIAETIKQAFAEFLAVPTCIILAFFALSAGSYLLDRAAPAWLVPLRNLLQAHVFADPDGTSSLLSAVAAGLITVTSITISLLLLALQQSAANMTAQILDQFLRRRINQAYFGFFVGLAAFSLLTLATVNKPFNPIFGATIAFLLTVVALYLLIILLYTTINQMRPVQIMETIHDHVLAARQGQLGLLRKTRRMSSFDDASCDGFATTQIRADQEGFVVQINVDAIGRAARDLPGGAEIVLEVQIGTYVAFHDLIASAKTHLSLDATRLTKIVQGAMVLQRQRNIATDAEYGVEQLAIIGWASISSAKHQLGAGLLVLHALRDIMAHWSQESSPVEDEKGKHDATPWPIVYQDGAFQQLLDAFESLAVVSSESMQYQIFAEVLRTFTVMYPRMPLEEQPQVDSMLRRIVPVLGDHVLTRELDSALTGIQQMLIANKRTETAALLRTAQGQMQQSVGKLNSSS